ncbi:O-antigen ligase family protein [Dysgonomonadaceae bacterium zrk40]|nr:O-antigen ligase family protein [Dysgonomonadaceae bacterium zrk40]
MERLRLIFLYIYLFSLSFENWSPWGGGTDLFRPALIFAMLYVIFSLFGLTRNFSLRYTKKFIYPSIALWLIITFSSILYSFKFPNAKFSLNYTLLACIVSFWLIYNDIYKEPKLIKTLVLIIIVNGIFLSLMSFFQIGIDIGYMGRESLLGNNPNIIGLSAVISMLIIVAILIDNPLGYSNKRFFLILFLPLLLQTIAKTGSKGALLLLMIGFLAYLLIMKKKFKFKFPLFFVGLIAFFFIYQYLLQNEVLSTRWNEFIETGNTTGRSERWFFALQTFRNFPIIGVGENGLEHLPSPFIGSNEPHNVYLYVLATGGIVAFIPFIILLIRLTRSVFQNRNIWRTVLPVVILIILLLHWFKAGGGLNSKLVWAYFAIISCNPIFNKNNIRNNEASNTLHKY